jgi:glycosyltransferase involved in cell wall biosynthesis
MHLAHFIQRYPPARGGSEAYFERLSRYLVEAGESVTVFTSNALDLEAFWSRHGRCLPPGNSMELGVEVRRYPLLRWPWRRYILKGLSFFPHRLWQCLTMPCNPVSPALWRDTGQVDWRFDAVHASAFPYAWPLVCARRLARQLHIPFFLTPFLHLGNPDDPKDPIRRAYTAAPLRWLLHEADVLFVQTPSEQRHLLHLGIAPEKVVLQGLGVDLADCTGGDRARARQNWGIAPDEVVIGHLANQSREKGTVDLLRACEPLWHEGLPVRLVLAGPHMPNFLHFWQTFAPVLGENPERRVVQLGVLDDAGKKDFFAGLDVFALPSRSDSFGLVLLEAWANAVPNVAYRAGGIADLIRHQQDGLLVPCGKIDLLTEALSRLVQDVSLREHLGRRGQERLPREFCWPDKLELVRRMYQKKLSGSTHFRT